MPYINWTLVRETMPFILAFVACICYAVCGEFNSRIRTSPENYNLKRFSIEFLITISACVVVFANSGETPRFEVSWLFVFLAGCLNGANSIIMSRVLKLAPQQNQPVCISLTGFCGILVTLIKTSIQDLTSSQIAGCLIGLATITAVLINKRTNWVMMSLSVMLINTFVYLLIGGANNLTGAFLNSCLATCGTLTFNYIAFQIKQFSSGRLTLKPRLVKDSAAIWAACFASIGLICFAIGCSSSDQDGALTSILFLCPVVLTGIKFAKGFRPTKKNLGVQLSQISSSALLTL